MTYTQNYQLPQWVKSDRIMMDDFNDANAKIDAALKSQADSLAGLETALTGGLAAKGNCQIYTGSYVGNGKYGANNRNTFTFPGKPLVVLIADPVDGYVLWAAQGVQQTYAYTSQGSILNLTWSGNTVQWFNYNTNIEQLNHPGRTYTILALLNSED